MHRLFFTRIIKIRISFHAPKARAKFLAGPQGSGPAVFAVPGQELFNGISRKGFITGRRQKIDEEYMESGSFEVVGGTAAVTVLVCDDHSVVRSGVRTALSSNPSIKIVGEAQNCDETLALVESLKPKVVILDIKLPGRTGLEVLHTLKQKQSSVNVLIFTMFDDEATILKAFASGAHGFILKSAPAAELLKATETLAANAIYIPVAFAHL